MCRVVHMDVYGDVLVQCLNTSVVADFVKGSAGVEPRMRVGRKTYVAEYFHFALFVESSGNHIQPVYLLFAYCSSVYLF
jgi:hypothetical protein